MNCLLTGASGFVGSNILNYLLEHTDWKFTAICSWRHHGNPVRVPKDKRVEVFTHDLTAPIPALGVFDAILNLASESHVDRSIIDPVDTIENNISSTLQMLEYAAKYVPTVFLQFSTDEVYGAMDHKDWDVLLPSNPYAASKAAQEMICIAYWKTYGVPVVITNSNNIVGPNQDPEKFVPKVVWLVNSGKTVEIHTTVKNGPGRRYWNPVENIASAIKFICERDPTAYNGFNDRPDKYGLGGGTELDNLEMAQLIAEILGKQLKYELVNAEIARPAYDSFYGSSDGGLEAVGWEPPIKEIAEGLKWIVP